MSNSQITSQLTRVTVPSIGNSNFAEGIRNAFETINNNFKIIASLPFIQGVQGDSYTLISKDIWTEVNNNITPVYYALTKEGAVLLNSIFESVLDDTKKFHGGDSFDECKTNKLSDLSLNGVSPIDSFFTEENGVVKPVNNKLYFYSVINNLNEEQDTYLGQYFYFIDYRITILGNGYQTENLYDFNDFTGFYQYQPASETEIERYNLISIVPNLYYDRDKDDICWKYNGQQTGISAMGPKGEDGKDATFKIVYVKYINDTYNSGDILGYFDSEQGAIEYTNTLDNCFCLIQFVNVVTNGDNTVTITSYVDSAYGEVYENKVYWQNSLKIGNLFNNQNITKYFCNMGNDPTGIENHPYYFAIPANLNRTNANEDSYKFGHVFSSSNGGNLVLQKAGNAFTEAGGQNPLNVLETEGTQNLFDIKNYDVNIDQNLTIGGTLGVSGTASLNSDLTVGGNTIINGETTINNNLNIITSFSEEAIFTIGGATIQGDVHIKQNNPGTSTGALTVDKKITGNNGLEITKNGAIIHDGIYAITKKPTTVSDKDSEGSADGLSNVLIGHNDPGNAQLEDFPKDLDKGGYPLVIKSLQSNGDVSNGAMVLGIGDIYALSGNDTDGYSAGTLCLNHRVRYRGDVQIGKDLNVGDSDVGGNVTIYSSSDNNGKLSVGNGADIRSNSINTVGLSVYGASGTTGFNGGIGLFVKGGTGGENLKGGAGIIVRGGDGSGTGTTGLGLDVQAGGAKIAGGLNTDTLTVTSSLQVTGDNATINGVEIANNKVKAQNGFFQTSDETLKDFHNDVQVDFEKLSLIPKKQFTWKSDEEKHMEIGTSAQEVRKLYPELVSENENGILSVAYDKLSIVALKAIDELYKKNQELERRIKELENKL